MSVQQATQTQTQSPSPLDIHISEYSDQQIVNLYTEVTTQTSFPIDSEVRVLIDLYELENITSSFHLHLIAISGRIATEITRRFASMIQQ